MQSHSAVLLDGRTLGGLRASRFVSIAKIKMIAKITVLEFVRQPFFLAASLAFPSLFFWFFGSTAVKEAGTVEAARYLSASFAAFGGLGAVFFQLLVQVATEKSSSWSTYLKTLPVHSFELMSMRVGMSLVLAALSMAAVFGTAVVVTDVDFTAGLLLKIIGGSLIALFPCAWWGLTLGHLVPGPSAVPIANLVYLPMSFAGGLWMPPEILPAFLKEFSLWLPTRHLGEVVWALTLERSIPDRSILNLAVTFALALVVSLATGAARRKS